MIKYKTEWQSIKIQIEDEQRLFAWNLINKVNFGQRGREDGTPAQQYAGVLGEVVFADFMGLERPQGKGYDYGTDFVIGGANIDLKTMGRDFSVKYHWVNNLKKCQFDFNKETDVYLFSSINKITKVFEILGWMKKYEITPRNPEIKFLDKGTPRERDDGTKFDTTGDLIEIPIKLLHPFVSPDIFVMEMGGIKLPR